MSLTLVYSEGITPAGHRARTIRVDSPVSVRNLPPWTLAAWQQGTSSTFSTPASYSMRRRVRNGPIEIAHPDKGAEMLLSELGVDDAYRRRGVGRALVEGLKDLAGDWGWSGMWVPVEPGNLATTGLYLATGAYDPEAGTPLWWDLA
ncbi:MAG: GNAT family N-acetyltransferase [Actinomycetia bacterium]|nr:GNAT family N-acetyltransferase [Actinomycetes bacterium]